MTNKNYTAIQGTLDELMSRMRTYVAASRDGLPSDERERCRYEARRLGRMRDRRVVELARYSII
ncbi:MAG: hypothetical protein QW331_02615 [Candidatus Woesearchaeota archaeon]